MKLAYLSFGSNLGDRAANIDQAIEGIANSQVRVTRRSSLYETEPRDVPHQPWFLNCVVEIRTELFPRQLLSHVRKVETALGRRRVVDKGPRTIDIDIVLFGNFRVDTPDLVIPHPRMAERRFVLEPLSELNPELRHPTTRETVRDMLTRVAGQKVTRLLVL